MSSGSAPATQDGQEGFPVVLQVLDAWRKHVGELVEGHKYSFSSLSEAVPLCGTVLKLLLVLSMNNSASVYEDLQYASFK